MTNKKQRIAIDQDWVLAKLTEKWVSYYNTLFEDDLKIEDIKDWNIQKYVKDEAKDIIFRILNLHKFYRDLEIRPDAVDVIKKLSEDYEIIFVTDYFTRASFKAKFDWLREHFPFVPRENLVFTGNKSLILADYLIDDGIHNLETFSGVGVLYDAPYNREEDRFDRVYSWKDIEEYFDTIKEEKNKRNKHSHSPSTNHFRKHGA